MTRRSVPTSTAFGPTKQEGEMGLRCFTAVRPQRGGFTGAFCHGKCVRVSLRECAKCLDLCFLESVGGCFVRDK